MPTHAELAGKLLIDAAAFFRKLADTNNDISKDMSDNAGVFEQVAELLQRDPTGSVQDKTVGGLAASLLRDAATFFKTIGDQNEPIQEQMHENARVFTEIAMLVEQNPLGILD